MLSIDVYRCPPSVLVATFSKHLIDMLRSGFVEAKSACPGRRHTHTRLVLHNDECRIQKKRRKYINRLTNATWSRCRSSQVPEYDNSHRSQAHATKNSYCFNTYRMHRGYAADPAYADLPKSWVQ